MNRRRTELPPVHRTYADTLRRIGDPAAGTRRECWAAETLDGQWTFQRLEDTRSNWTLRHLPTGFSPVIEEWSSLQGVLESLVDGYVWCALWRDATWQLGTREHPAPAGEATGHDTARALLTWMVDAGVAPVRVPEHA